MAEKIKTSFVLQDADQVYGLLTVEGLTYDGIMQIFSDVKYEMEGYWTVDDLIEGIKESGHKYSWETEIGAIWV